MTKDNERKKQQYIWITKEIKQNLIAGVKQGYSMKHTARQLGIPYSNAKKIVKRTVEQERLG